MKALRLYEQLGFVRDKRLYRYYLNGVDAFRLKLWTGIRLLAANATTTITTRSSDEVSS
jgi:ribosomal protein S18 acetylase RimI-like enzyme